jgi:hypothetical protein
MKKIDWRAREAARIRLEKRAKRGRRSAQRMLRSSRRPFISYESLKAHEKATLKIPEVFSMLEDPENVLQVIKRIDRLVNDKSIKNIHIDHSACRVLGLCASTVMDVLLIEGQRRRGGRRFLIFSGTLSEHEDVKVMIKASGILRHLRLPEAELPRELEERIIRFALRSGSAKKADFAAGVNQAGTDVTEYFNRCLRTQGFELNDEGVLKLSCLLTETLNNAEDHGGGTWYVIGHWDPRQGKDGDCHVVIFNFGTTIYESLKAPESSEALKEGLHELSQTHQSGGWFSMTSGVKWGEEGLWTLYALQDRVTRFYKLEAGRDRGNGTIKMIEFFDELSGDAKKKMCVVSGSTYILFNGKYNLAPVERDGEELKIIAFNKENRLDKPPDPDCVRQMSESFGGTLISLTLTLDSAFLDSAKKKRYESNQAN